MSSRKKEKHFCFSLCVCAGLPFQTSLACNSIAVSATFATPSRLGGRLMGALGGPLPFTPPRHLCCLWASLSRTPESNGYTSRLSLHPPNDACYSHTTPSTSQPPCSFGKKGSHRCPLAKENAPKMPSSSPVVCKRGHGGRSRASVSLTCIDAWVPH